MKKKPVELEIVTPPEELARQRIEAEKLVQERKRAADAGIIVPVASREEFQARRNAAENILCIGDIMKELMPSLQEASLRSEAFVKEVKEKIAKTEKEKCDEHPDLELPVDMEATIGHSWKNRKFTIVFGRCDKCEEEEKRIWVKARWSGMGIPDRLVNESFDTFDIEGNPDKEKAKNKFLKHIKRGNGGFILALGKVGTGKSHLGVGAIKKLGRGIFITMHDLVGELRQTYSSNESADDMIEKYRTTDVLVLDEVSTDVFDPDQKKGLDIPPLLYRVFGYRHDKNLLSIFTSNNDLEIVLKIFGPKLRDRMRENYTVANFTWESHRQPQKS